MTRKFKALAEMAAAAGLFTAIGWTIFGLYAMKVGHPIW